MNKLNSKIVLKCIFRGILIALTSAGTIAVMNKVEENKKTSSDTVIEKTEVGAKQIYQVDNLVSNQR
ncbi:hypothetical protein HDR59_02640 [bacterium]|nr:hypothetical protein [bacterium]